MSELRHVSTRSLKRAYRAAFRRYNRNTKAHYFGLASHFKDEMTRLANELDKRGEKP